MTVILNIKGIEKLADPAEAKKRQEEYAMRVAFVMRKYVPRDENTLRASEQLNSKYAEGLLRPLGRGVRAQRHARAHQVRRIPLWR